MKERTARAVKWGAWYYIVNGKGKILINARYNNYAQARLNAKLYNNHELSIRDILNIQ